MELLRIPIGIQANCLAPNMLCRVLRSHAGYWRICEPYISRAAEWSLFLYAYASIGCNKSYFSSVVLRGVFNRPSVFVVGLRRLQFGLLRLIRPDIGRLYFSICSTISRVSPEYVQRVNVLCLDSVQGYLEGRCRGVFGVSLGKVRP